MNNNNNSDSNNNNNNKQWILLKFRCKRKCSIYKLHRNTNTSQKPYRYKTKHKTQPNQTPTPPPPTTTTTTSDTQCTHARTHARTNFSSHTRPFPTRRSLTAHSVATNLHNFLSLCHSFPVTLCLMAVLGQQTFPPTVGKSKYTSALSVSFNFMTSENLSRRLESRKGILCDADGGHFKTPYKTGTVPEKPGRRLSCPVNRSLSS